MWAKELPRRMLKLSIRVSGCLDRLEIHCRDIPLILEQVGWGAGSTCSRFCGRVIIFLNHHIAIKPISPETAAKHCFAPGNGEKGTPGRPRFDILNFQMKYWKNCVNWDSGPVSRKCRLQTGYQMQTRCKMHATADCRLPTRYKTQTENKDFFHEIRAILWLTQCHTIAFPRSSWTAVFV